MKYIALILCLCVTLVSCGGNNSSKSSSPVSSENINTTQTSISKENCESQAQEAGKKLVDANKNPDVELSFLGTTQIESQCLLQVQITQKIPGNSVQVFTLFDTKTEKRYKNFATLEEMNAEIELLSQ